MSACIVEISASKWAAKARSDAASVVAAEAEHMHFWRGASGRCYVHSVYRLTECPPMPTASYVLARKSAKGKTEALAVGRVCHDAPTLNLAEIRHRAARIGATEVHLHLLASTAHEAGLVELDLAASLLPAQNCNELSAERCSALAS